MRYILRWKGTFPEPLRSQLALLIAVADLITLPCLAADL